MNIAPAAPISEFDQRALYEVLRSRDRRFDGRVFIGVKTTGIYCRPVCPHMPKIENCTFHLHAAVAEKAGFRPCLVCRPELAPGDAKVEAVSKLARLALRRIEDGALNEINVAALAEEFGVTDRHLHRAMRKEFGVTPIELAQTQRLLQAKQLLTETDLSVTDVAFSAGFESLRRFNALFKSRYRLAPRALRRNSLNSGAPPRFNEAGNTLSFRIDYRPPFAWQTLLAFLGERAIPGVETTSDNAYLRTVRIGDHTGWIAVSPYVTPKRARPIHALTLTLSASLWPVCIRVLTQVKTLFDTRANATDIDRHLARDPVLAASVHKHRGMRLPGAFDGFELLLRAILGQQISVKGATTLAGRMANVFGESISTGCPALFRLSPAIERIAHSRVDRIARIGVPRKRAETIRFAAKAALSGELVLAPGSDPDVVREQLLAIPGIGEWTASYVAMRALAWPDALPLGDLGVKKALDLTRPADITARTETWRPWRAYGVIHLWLSLSSG